MNKDLIEKVRKWVKDNKCLNEKHLFRTGYWVKKLDTNASEALVIAAITHDVERSFEKGRKPPVDEFNLDSWDNPVYDKWHSERSARFVSEFLESQGAEKKLIDEVAELISHHEHGGFKDADTLRDADSLSFLEITIDRFLEWVGERSSKEDIKKKFDYMFNRIGSKKAKKLAEPLYKKALEKLDNVAD